MLIIKKIEKIKSLINELNAASKAYYETGRTIMDDSEFDTKLEQLKKLEWETGIVLSNSPTHNVGYMVTDKVNKEELDHPMLSLDKCHSPEDIFSFLGGKSGYVSIKLDGNSITARYENGKLVGLHSRGNGIIGNDLMIHAASFKNLPLTIPTKGTFIVDGEAIITKDDFEKINAGLSDNEKFANSRNLVAGTLSLLDSKTSLERCLKFVVWNLIQDDNMTNDYLDNLMICESQGFEVVPNYYLTEKLYDEQTIKDKLDMLKSLAERYQYPMDGAVVTFADVAYGKTLGRTEKFFKHSIAYKYEDEIAETELTDIEWSVGKTKITPVAHFKPIVLDGTTVTKASLHNVSIFKNLKLGQNDKLSVYKANLIIPQVKENLTQSNNCTIPEKCPCCGEPTEIICQNISEELICTNSNCPAKLIGKLTHFCSRDAINIEGMSEATIQKVMDCGVLQSFQDIYHLQEHYDKLLKIDGLGKKSIDKLLTAIQASRETTFSKLLYSLSIPMIGKTASKMLEGFCDSDFETFATNLTNGGSQAFEEIEGFGTEMGNSLYEWWKENATKLNSLLTEFVIKKSTKSAKEPNSRFENKTFCITGSVQHFANRNELKELLESLGAKVTNSVTSKTDYLINNDVDSSSSKNKTAKKLGIPIVNEAEIISLLNRE